MNLRSVIFSLSLVALISSTSFKVNAMEKITKTSEEAIVEQPKDKEIAKKFSPGESFVQGGITYTVYPKLKADYHKSKNKLSSKEQNKKSNIVMVKKAFTIYNDDGLNKKENHSNDNQIVFNEKSESFEVLSGIIIVKMKNEAIFKDPSFEIVKSYPKLGYYLIKIPSQFKIQDSLNKIQKMTNVDETSVEIIENIKEPL